MKTRSDDSWLGLLLVVALHAGAGAALVNMPSPAKSDVVPPSIQGVLITAPPAELVQQPSAKKAPPKKAVEAKPKPKPRPEPKPTHKPKPKKLPPVEAPPSERAIRQERMKEEVKHAPAPPVQHKAAVTEKDNNSQGAPVTPPKHDANPLNNPAPAYPSISRRLREEGVVVLLLLVLPDGSVGEIKIKESSGFERLDKTAIKAVKRWKYIPATRGGTPIEYWYLQPLEFSLNG